MLKLSIRAVAVWMAIIFVESVHATLRRMLLEPRVGDFRARQIGVFTGMLLILAVSLLFVRWIRAENKHQLLFVGISWTALTIIFEITLGRLTGLSWERIFSDYDIINGGFMPIGLLFLILSPLIAFKIRAKNEF